MERLADRIATSDDPPCAVVDCANAGRPQICPYDQRYHRHGHTEELDAQRIRVGVPV